MRTFPAPNTSTSLQRTLVADAHLAEGQFLLGEQTLNNAKSLIYRAGTRRPTISKAEGHNATNLNSRNLSGERNCVLFCPIGYEINNERSSVNIL
jgi:hypothetical protein